MARTYYSGVRFRALSEDCKRFSQKRRIYNKGEKKLLYLCDHYADHLHKRNLNENFLQQIVRYK